MKTILSRNAPSKFPGIERLPDECRTSVGRPGSWIAQRSVKRLLGTFWTLIWVASTGFGQQPSREDRFIQAQPVWLEGPETEMNVTAGFRALIDCPAAETVTARLTAASIYRLSVNGVFVGHGPARAAHGDFRIDEWPLSAYLREGVNVVAVEVTSYNANSYYLLDQPGFLAAEVVRLRGVAGSTVRASITR
jgi:hypothetical protein